MKEVVSKIEEVNKILQRTDWKEYWHTVSKNAQKEIDAYRVAAIRSYAKAHERWLR